MTEGKDEAKLDRSTQKTREALKAAQEEAAAAPPSRSEIDAAAGRLALWADETRKKQARSGVEVTSHELLGVSEQEYKRMAKKRPAIFWGKPKDADVAKAAKIYPWSR